METAFGTHSMVEVLRYLCRLAGTRLTFNDQDLVVLYGSNQVLFEWVDGQTALGVKDLQMLHLSFTQTFCGEMSKGFL